MAIFCSHCGTKLEDFMKFCYNCGNPPKDAAALRASGNPKVEYKQADFDLSQGPLIEYVDEPAVADRVREERKGKLAAERQILEMLKPYFVQGWQLDGTFGSAVSLQWVEKGFLTTKYRLQSATARLIRYS